MSEIDQPDWSALPHDPEKFFELSTDYSRKDLKRSFNRLLRQFKPERAPEEFQRIRAAYEQLDNSLRYGERTFAARPAKDTFDWQAAVDESEDQSPDQQSQRSEIAPTDEQCGSSNRSSSFQPSKSPQELVVERLQTESPDKIYTELSEQEQKTPFDFYVLAILSDTVQKPDSLRFVKWILAGLKKFPAEVGLQSLLYATLRGTFSQKSIPRILIAVSKSVRSDRFYSLTEPLWDTLLRTEQFEVFEQVLSDCESELRDFRIEGKVAFYIHILRPAMWLATRSWIDEALGFVNENENAISYAGEFELEMLGALYDYRLNRSAFLDGNDLRDRMDEAIQSYCLDDEQNRDRKFIECQIDIATNGDDVLDAFEFDLHTPPPVILSVWEWINMDVGERLSELQDEDEIPTSRPSRIRSFLSSLEERTNSSSIGRMWNLIGEVYFWMNLGGVYIVLILTLIFLFNIISDSPSMSAAVVLGAVGGVALQKWGFPKMWSSTCRRLALRCYAQFWRKEVQQLLRRSGMSLQEFCETLENTDLREYPAMTWVMILASYDESMVLFVSTRKYLV